jgi:hypothetical protein
MCECGHELNTFGTHLTHYTFGSQQITTHDAIKDIMYVVVRRNGHVEWIEQWYIHTLRVSLRTNLYMTHEDQVFIANVVVTNLPWKIVIISVISQLASVNAKLKTIVKIHKYRWLCERQHFILMVTEVHNAPRHDMDRFFRECACFFHDKQSRGHLSLSFCIQFFKQHVSIAFQCALAFTIEGKIALAGNVYSKPPITSKFHDLHASNIKRVVGEIISYHNKD